MASACGGNVYYGTLFDPKLKGFFSSGIHTVSLCIDFGKKIITFTQLSNNTTSMIKFTPDKYFVYPDKIILQNGLELTKVSEKKEDSYGLIDTVASFEKLKSDLIGYGSKPVDESGGVKILTAKSAALEMGLSGSIPKDTVLSTKRKIEQIKSECGAYENSETYFACLNKWVSKNETPENLVLITAIKEHITEHIKAMPRFSSDLERRLYMLGKPSTSVARKGGRKKNRRKKRTRKRRKKLKTNTRKKISKSKHGKSKKRRVSKRRRKSTRRH